MGCTEPPIVNLQILQIPVNGPGDIDRLFIFTGTAEVGFQGGRENDTCTLQISLLKPIQAPDFGIFHPLTYVALSSVQNSAEAQTEGINVDWNYGLGGGLISDPETNIVDGTLTLRATLMCDEFGSLNRVDFQVYAPVSSAKLH